MINKHDNISTGVYWNVLRSWLEVVRVIERNRERGDW
jgi:hypothetical protein